MTIIRRGQTPQEQALHDNTQALAQYNADILEYIAMMADIEIPSEDDGGIADEQEV